MKIDEVTLYQLVAFAVFMQHGDGIITKSPDYIREKFNLCTATTHPESLQGGMDSENIANFELWRQRWIFKKSS